MIENTAMVCYEALIKNLLVTLWTLYRGGLSILRKPLDTTLFIVYSFLTEKPLIVQAQDLTSLLQKLTSFLNQSIFPRRRFAKSDDNTDRTAPYLKRNAFFQNEKKWESESFLLREDTWSRDRENNLLFNLRYVISKDLLVVS